MNILRQPPFPFELSYEDLTADETYILEIYADHSELIVSEQVTASSLGVVSYTLPKYFEKYDGTYSLYIYTMDVDEVADETVVIDNLYIYRPYYNPSLLAEEECEIEEYVALEQIARQIIDTLVGGFYYETGAEEMNGLGADYLGLPRRANKINIVYENNVKVYDRFDPIDGQQNYIITPDGTGMTIAQSGVYNRLESKSVHMPVGASDSYMLYGDMYDQVAALTEIQGVSLFPNGFDYTVYGDWGWSVVPNDIKNATKLLIDDIKCGKLDHISKYITEYQTDQFKVKYSNISLEGSGNLIVDKILQSYSIPVYRLGVL